jgi:hypothetical protein
MRCTVLLKPTLVATLGFVLACSSSGDVGAPGGNGSHTDAGPYDAGGSGAAPVTLTGKVIDRDTGNPLAGTIVIVEVGGLYQANADTSKGNPYYKISALAGLDGAFSVLVPSGMVGLHTFEDGYYYGVLGPIDTALSPSANVVKAKALLPLDRKPTVAKLALSPATVAPSGSVTIGADVTEASISATDDAGADGGAHADPLSEEVIAAETTTSWAAILDPPSPGIQGTGFPDGHYSKTFTAPSKAGIYTYSLVVSSEGCITSDRATATLTVQ